MKWLYYLKVINSFFVAKMFMKKVLNNFNSFNFTNNKIDLKLMFSFHDKQSDWNVWYKYLQIKFIYLSAEQVLYCYDKCNRYWHFISALVILMKESYVQNHLPVHKNAPYFFMSYEFIIKIATIIITFIFFVFFSFILSILNVYNVGIGTVNVYIDIWHISEIYVKKISGLFPQYVDSGKITIIFFI